MGKKLSSIGGRMARARIQQTETGRSKFTGAFKNEKTRGVTTKTTFRNSATKNEARRARGTG